MHSLWKGGLGGNLYLFRRLREGDLKQAFRIRKGFLGMQVPTQFGATLTSSLLVRDEGATYQTLPPPSIPKRGFFGIFLDGCPGPRAPGADQKSIFRNPESCKTSPAFRAIFAGLLPRVPLSPRKEVKESPRVVARRLGRWPAVLPGG